MTKRHIQPEMSVEELESRWTGMTIDEVREFHALLTPRAVDRCVFLEMQDPEFERGREGAITLSSGRPSGHTASITCRLSALKTINTR